MRTIKCGDYHELSVKAAEILAGCVGEKADCILGLATGSTPVGLYQELIGLYQAGKLDFSRVRTVNLDEYVGLAPEHPQSYRYFMEGKLFRHINIAPENTHLPNGLSDDPEEEGRRYDRMIEALGGIDLQILGIGHNGHIGFNEPAEVFTPGTHAVELSESTIKANSRFFAAADEVPRRAITMGIGSIMRAKKILILVEGAAKAEILKAAFAGPVDPRVPASILQLHRDMTLIADKAALSCM